MLESESHDMIDAALYVQTNRSIGEIEQRLNHITQLHIQLQERLNHMDESQRMMHEKINYLIGKQTVQFSCVDTISPLGSKFDFGDMETEEGHNNSSNGSKGDIATKEFLKRKRGQGLPSKSDGTDLNPPAKSPETEFRYYKQFPLQLRNGPAADNLGAHAGLKNSNVNCYSNAIIQCIASCICFSDFSPPNPNFKWENQGFCGNNGSVHGEWCSSFFREVDRFRG